MVRTRGPLFSADASGTFGKVLNFSTNKGVSYARRVPQPPDLKTPPQLSSRAITAFLSQQWKLLSKDDKRTWKAYSKPTKGSPYNAYLAHNLHRWSLATSPSQTPDPTDPPPIIHPPGFLLDPSVKTITAYTLNGAWLNIWGWALYRGPTALSTQAHTSVVALFLNLAFVSSYVDKHLCTGQTYFYRTVPFDRLGNWGPDSSILSETPL